MRALALSLLLVLALCGATCQRRGEAPPADAPAICYQPCTPSLSDTGVRWEGDPEDPAAWDALAAPQDGVVGILAGKLLTCEAKRQACAGFITDLHTRGVLLRAERKR
jgi:hypothetical protein